MSNPIGLAIIGLGRMGSTYLQIASELRAKADLIGVLTTSPNKREKLENLRLKVFSDLNELLRDPRVDAVVIANPSGLHYRTVSESLRAGKHVFVEKPLTLKLSEALDLIRLAHNAELNVTVSYNRRYDDTYLELKEQVQGNLKHYLGISRDPVPPQSGWLLNPALSGDLVFDLGIHEFDLFIWLAVKHLSLSELVKCLSNSTVYTIVDERDENQILSCRVLIRGPISATIILSRKSPIGYELKSEVLTDKGVYITGWSETPDNNIISETYQFRGDVPWFIKRFYRSYKRSLETFIDSISAGSCGTLEVKLQYTLGISLAECALQSAYRGESLELSRLEGWEDLVDLIRLKIA